MPHAPRASKKELEWLKKLRLALGLHRLHLAREGGRSLQPILESVPGQEPEAVRPCAARRMPPSLWRRRNNGGWPEGTHCSPNEGRKKQRRSPRNGNSWAAATCSTKGRRPSLRRTRAGTAPRRSGAGNEERERARCFVQQDGKAEADERDDETDGSRPYKCAEVKRPNVVPRAPIDLHIRGPHISPSGRLRRVTGAARAGREAR